MFKVLIVKDFIPLSKKVKKTLDKIYFCSIFAPRKKIKVFIMYWTLELASKMEDAPWPATREELLEWAMRYGLPQEIIENLEELEDEDGDVYERIEDLWPDYPTKDDFFFHEDEY